MQVMQSDEFSKTEVLVGQTNATVEYKVSNDAMLMSMLSTGFYGNPLRTMIQEIMFNAWDAHCMGNCQDKPIDVYVNEASGLIIRDYGPGIPDDKVEDVYCVYGGSTKRNDKRQTGGFGLGSKSPMAYAESFTVTSMNQNTKCVYLNSRVSDENGKPGFTRLVKINTVETGLIVTVPLEATDRLQAHRYIKDILFLSGIKANIHYLDEDPELVESKSMAPGEYVLDNNGSSDRGLFAVYGGVRYKIPLHADYEKEYKFLQLISRNTSLSIGFAADTLTPLPNREGLNMSHKCREAVKTGLELCTERFRTVIDPLINAYIRKSFDHLVELNIEPHFALYRVLSVHEEAGIIDSEDFYKTMASMVAYNTDPSVWKIALATLTNNTQLILGIIGNKRWIQVIVQQFIIAYPNHKELGFAVLKEDSNNVLHNRYTGEPCARLMSAFTNPTLFRDLYDFENQMKQAYPNDETLHPTFRRDSNDVWVKLTRTPLRLSNKYPDNRPIPKAVRVPPNSSKFFEEKGNTEVVSMFVQRTILLAKTTAALKDTHLSSAQFFASKSQPLRSYNITGEYPILACVVHNRKGAYEKAKQILESKGYKVLEGEEPIPKVRKAAVKTVTTYPLVNTAHSNWVNPDPATEVENPTHFLYLTQSLINSYEYYARKDKPSKELVRHMMKLHPQMVMIHNVTTANALENKGVISFEKAVRAYFEQLKQKKVHFRNVVRFIKLQANTTIPNEMLRDPIIQKAIGATPIDLNKTPSFWNDFDDFLILHSMEYRPLADVSKELEKLIEDTWKKDPLSTTIPALQKKIKVFSSNELGNVWRYSNPEQRVAFAKKFTRFIQDK